MPPIMRHGAPRRFFGSYVCVFGGGLRSLTLLTKIGLMTSSFWPHLSKAPERGVGDEEIAERLQARDILHFFRIGQPAFEHRHFRAQIEPR